MAHLMKKKTCLLAIFLLLLLCAYPAHLYAQAQDTTSQAQFEPTRFGVGFQSTWPAFGLSGMMDITETITAQAVFGFFGSFTTVTGRGLYHFRQEEFWDMYGYGMLGLWRYNTRFIEAENSLGIGVGAGIQYDWRALDSNLPPIYWSIELGISYFSFEEFDFNFITFGTGIHYRF